MATSSFFFRLIDAATFENVYPEESSRTMGSLMDALMDVLIKIIPHIIIMCLNIFMFLVVII